MRVKICGITNIPDALASIDAGADALGFIFAPSSPRFLKVDAAAAIIRELPPLIARVGVFADPTAQFVQEAVAKCGLSAVQLHGSETPEFCAGFPGLAIKAFRISRREDIEQVRSYSTRAWLLDSHVPGQMGGTGKRFDWDLAVEVKQWGSIILAGGLTPDNVAEAVIYVQPYAVDVSSGVESSPGKKDITKVRAFISAAKEAASSHR